MTDLSTLASASSGSSPSAITSDDLKSEDIAQHRFSTSFRGYDTDEVRSFLKRVAAQQRTVQDKLTGLSAELEAARTVLPAAPVIDLTGDEGRSHVEGEDGLTEQRLAGEELLENARQEAALILARANDEAARIQLRARAESRGKTPDGARVALSGDAPEDTDTAKVQAKAMIAEARAVRERILTDLNKRRRTAHIQLEQLRAAREKLQETMREARRVIDASSRDLTHADVEARLAAEAAGRRVAAEPLPTVDELEAELSGGRHFGATSRSISVEAEDESPVVEATVTEADEVVEVVEVADEATHPLSTHPLSTLVSLGASDDIEPVVVIIDVVAVGSQLEGVGRPGEHRSSAAEREPSVEAADDVVDNVVDVETTESVDVPVRTRKVDDLFAKLRAEREASSQRAREVLATPAPTSRGTSALAEAMVVTEAAVEETTVEESEHYSATPVQSPDDEAVLGQRERSLELVRLRASKQMKRHLQDEHGAALASLRRARGRVTVENLVGREVDQRGACVTLLLPAIHEAAAAGQRLVSGREDQVASLMVRCAEIAEGVAADLSSPVRDRLSDAIDDQTEDLATVLGQTYREWTTDRLSDRVREALTAGFSAGAFCATTPGVPVRWILDDGEQPCSDCDDNVLNGVQSSGEAFPTGELYPPVHPGCRCLVVPAGPLMGLGDS